jgi:hypothetical protein
MAPVGRWQKGKDILWWTKAASAEQRSALQDEKERMRENDQALIDEALGLKPKRRVHHDSLEKDELKVLLARGTTERGSIDIERVQGLGAAPAKFHEHIER